MPTNVTTLKAGLGREISISETTEASKQVFEKAYKIKLTGGELSKEELF